MFASLPWRYSAAISRERAIPSCKLPNAVLLKHCIRIADIFQLNFLNNSRLRIAKRVRNSQFNTSKCFGLII